MRIRKNIKEFASKIAFSFFYASIFIIMFYFLLNNKISSYISMINTLAVKEGITDKIAKYDITTKKLVVNPKYGDKYGTLQIDTINLKLPIYFGDSKKILRLGVGHYNGSYFPGEGGSIIYAAHNNVGYFNKLDKVKIDDLVTIKTNYGKFTYQVYDSKVVKETDLSAFPISREEEILIMYTCWPINRTVVGRKTERLVVYAKKVGEIYE